MPEKELINYLENKLKYAEKYFYGVLTEEIITMKIALATLKSRKDGFRYRDEHGAFCITELDAVLKEIEDDR